MPQSPEQLWCREHQSKRMVIHKDSHDWLEKIKENSCGAETHGSTPEAGLVSTVQGSGECTAQLRCGDIALWVQQLQSKCRGWEQCLLGLWHGYNIEYLLG